MDDLKTLSRRFYESYDQNQPFAGFLAEGCTVHLPGAPPLDRDSFLAASAQFSGAFSDSKTTFVEQVAEGSAVFTRWIWEITHVHDFQGIPATGKRVSLAGATLNRFEDGKIVEQWVVFDRLSLLEQLGVLP